MFHPFPDLHREKTINSPENLEPLASILKADPDDIERKLTQRAGKGKLGGPDHQFLARYLDALGRQGERQRNDENRRAQGRGDNAESPEGQQIDYHPCGRRLVK